MCATIVATSIDTNTHTHMSSDTYVSPDDAAVANASRTLVKRDGSANRALFNACISERTDICAYLVRHLGADVNAIDDLDDGRCTPLIFTAAEGFIDVCRFLVWELGADVNIRDRWGGTAVHMAAHLGLCEMARVLVQELGADANAVDDAGNTPLHSAAKSLNSNVARLLVQELGAKVNARNSEWKTPLMLTVMSSCRVYPQETRDVDTIRVLVKELGADVNAKSCGDAGNTALHEAMLNTNRAVNDTHKLVTVLVTELGADVCSRDFSGQTFLHLAASRGTYDGLIRFSVKSSGADVNARDTTNGDTPLHYAVWHGHIESVRLLVELGADVESLNDEEWRPIHTAALYRRRKIFSLLVDELGADANARCNNGLTPLHIAANEDQTTIAMQLLTKFGADVNARSVGGYTPLHIAARNFDKKLGVIKLLIAFGADVGAKNDYGYTPLHFSFQSRMGIVRSLADNGADIVAEDSKSNTPLHLVALKGETKAMQVLSREYGGDVQYFYETAKIGANSTIYSVCRQ